MIDYPQYKKVLFCTDFSENADYAFDFAYGIAKRDEGTLYILHIIPYNSNQAYAESFLAMEDLEKIQRAVEGDIANNYNERYVNKIKNEIAYELITKTGRKMRRYSHLQSRNT